MPEDEPDLCFICDDEATDTVRHGENRGFSVCEECEFNERMRWEEAEAEKRQDEPPREDR